MREKQSYFNPMISMMVNHAIKREDAALNLNNAENTLFSIQAPKISLSSKQLLRLSNKIVEETENPNIGLRFGESLQLKNLGVLGHMAMSSSNFFQAMQSICSHYQLVSNMTKLHLKSNSQMVEINLKLKDDDFKDYHRIILEGALATIKNFSTELTGQTIRADEIHFSWPEPIDKEEYEHLFDARLFFNKPITKIIYDRGKGEILTRMPNNEVFGILENHVKKHRYDENYKKVYSSLIVKVLTKSKGELLRVEQAASAIGTSVRNLQIKLKKEGTTYKRLRDQVMYKESQMLLKDHMQTIEAISEILGFSEPAAFYRSFKRWSGITPREYRVSKLF